MSGPAALALVGAVACLAALALIVAEGPPPRGRGGRGALRPHPGRAGGPGLTRGQHDDLVLAVAGPLWWPARRSGGVRVLAG